MKYNHLAKQGFRVLALAYKNVEKNIPENWELLENDLTFAGFLVLVNKLKHDTVENI